MKDNAIGRIVFRSEDMMWKAYYTLPDTMDDAILLGSICLYAIRTDMKRKEDFVAMMKGIVEGFAREIADGDTRWGEKTPHMDCVGNA